MRKSFKERADESTFELNLAPMLDIIVSIIPMLLISVAFVQITIIDTPVPQVVEKAMIANENNKDAVLITLAVSKQLGFRYTIVDKGQTKETVIAPKGAELDLDGLYAETIALKKSYPEVFRLELNPEENIELNELVAVMDKIRTISPNDKKITFKDVDSGNPVETNLVFPDIVFGNVAGG